MNLSSPVPIDFGSVAREIALQRIVDQDRAIILDLREKLARAEQERDDAMRQLQEILSLVDDVRFLDTTALKE